MNIFCWTLNIFVCYVRDYIYKNQVKGSKYLYKSLSSGVIIYVDSFLMQDGDQTIHDNPWIRIVLLTRHARFYVKIKNKKICPYNFTLFKIYKSVKRHSDTHTHIHTYI